MAKKDINSKPYPEATMLKLDIFRRCFREWFPVFVHHPSIQQIFIYDMFAGSGSDSEGNPGSPIILLEEAKGNERQHCKALAKNNKYVVFGFNEKESGKKELLEKAKDDFLLKCKSDCPLERCIYSNSIYCKDNSFEDIMKSNIFENILTNENYAKFVLLDQYGFSQITKDVFLKLVASPLTDFIFFISSSFIKRFRDVDSVKTYINTNNLAFEENKPKECHRIIASYFRNMTPADKEYYIHHFTIKKGANYYGLIFGTSHTLGMEKFVKVCWIEDEKSGESNCNIDNDFEKGTFFYDPSNTTKKTRIKEELEHLILNGNIESNVEGLKWVLSHGCEPKLFVEIVSSLVEQRKIAIQGKFNKRSSNIHRIEEYKIEVL
ncbi:MAG: three-Cys-motif partner protein TcmP [Prevotella sp.]|nr:three-Cys-motif partner protein TcmP [Prevotella sp.]